MSAPKYIPVETKEIQGYRSPKSRYGIGEANKVAKIDGLQPKGDMLGVPGPDQGYAYKLVANFEDRIFSGSIAHDDVISGCVALAMRRAALFGRAPVIHDLEAAFTIFGFLRSSVDNKMIEFREPLFEEIASSHHYMERRRVVDVVKERVLRKPPKEIARLCDENWAEPFKF